MSNDEFTKLFKHMTERFDKIDAALEKKSDKADVDGMNTRFDDVMAELDDIKTEQAAQHVQLDRHERWHHETAAQIGLTLNPDA
jgi:hypothetical protein